MIPYMNICYKPTQTTFEYTKRGLRQCVSGGASLIGIVASGITMQAATVSSSREATWSLDFDLGATPNSTRRAHQGLRGEPRGPAMAECLVECKSRKPPTSKDVGRDNTQRFEDGHTMKCDGKVITWRRRGINDDTS